MENSSRPNRVRSGLIKEFQRKIRETADHLRDMSERGDVDEYTRFKQETERFCKETFHKEYTEVLDNLDLDGLDDGDYVSLERPGLKRKLFDYRARIYLDALRFFAERGEDPAKLFDSLIPIKLLPIKEENSDKTYSCFKDNFLD